VIGKETVGWAGGDEVVILNDGTHPE